MSVLKFAARGLGSALTDPYSFVTGGLYTRASENISSGIERGVGFAFGGESWAAYDNIDFGAVGSDTVTVSIWANTNDPVDVRFYDGIPDDGGRLLGSYKYHKKPEWMVFKEETYKLPYRLKGVKTLCIETDCGYQLKGFRFIEKKREFDVNYAAEAEQIYGDKFTTGHREVTGIGNNVMLDFGEFDFSERQPQKLIISGKSPLPLNSIHLILSGGEGEERIICEFGTDNNLEYSERIFDLKNVSGRKKVSFAFLPGSNFDFNYFRFV